MTNKSDNETAEKKVSDVRPNYFVGAIVDNVEIECEHAKVNSRPTVKRTVEYHSIQAQRVIQRSFTRVKGAFYSISIILNTLTKDDEVVQRIDDYVDQQFMVVEKEILDAQARIKKILDDNGIEESINYSNPKKFTLFIDSPRINNFLKLLTQLDRLILLMDTAWLANELNDVQLKNGSYQWQRRVMKFAGSIVNLENRARSAASKKGKEAEVNKLAPVDQSKQHEELEMESQVQDNDLKLEAIG